MSTPSGRPASANSSARKFAADGSFSLGLSTTVLPQAIAFGTNHSGTIAGKLNGEITPTTPSGWRIEYTSTPVEAFSLNPPLQQVRDPAGELDDLQRALHLAGRVGRAPCRARR